MKPVVDEHALRLAVADDVAVWSDVFDREWNAVRLDALLAAGFPNGLALLPDAEAFERLALLLQKTALAAAEKPLWDELAADYAGLFLTGAYGVSPCESFWLTDERLVCQWPMFRLRAEYRQAGWRATNWRQRAEDHLVSQLAFLGVQLADTGVPLEQIGVFIDRHLGAWAPTFCVQGAGRVRTSLFAELLQAFGAWLGRMREVIEQVSGVLRLSPEAVASWHRQQQGAGQAEVAPIKFAPFVPGAGPSW